MHTVVGISCITKSPMSDPGPCAVEMVECGGLTDVCVLCLRLLQPLSPPVCDLVGSDIWIREGWEGQTRPAERARCHHRRSKTSDLDKPAAECGSPAMTPGRPSNRGI